MFFFLNIYCHIFSVCLYCYKSISGTNKTETLNPIKLLEKNTVNIKMYPIVKIHVKKTSNAELEL